MSLNKNGTVTLCGIEFDLPKKSDLRKWDYKEWKEARSIFKEIWLNNYHSNHKDTLYYLFSYKLTSKNGTTFFLDDKKLKDEDIENAKFIFKTLDEKL